MKKILAFAMKVAGSGIVDPAHLRGNKKQVALKVAKTTAFYLIQKHPAYIAVKLGLYAAAMLAIIILASILYFAF